MNKDSLFIYEEDGFCELKYTFKDLKRLERKNKNLQNNRNELKKWLEEEIKEYEESSFNIKEPPIRILVIMNILSKMTELERGEE